MCLILSTYVSQKLEKEHCRRDASREELGEQRCHKSEKDGAEDRMGGRGEESNERKGKSQLK